MTERDRARQHVAELGRKLAQMPESGWNLLLVGELRKRPGTFDHLCSESVEWAMHDVGVDEALIERVCKKLEAARMLLPSKLTIRMKR